MKKTSRILSLILAVTMAVMSLTFAAFAEPGETTTTYTVTITGNTSDKLSYSAYQIFSGTVSDTEEKLEDINWGTGINSEGFLSALVSANTDDNSALKGLLNGITTSSTAANVAAALGGISSDAAVKEIAAIAKANTATIAATSNTAITVTGAEGAADTYNYEISGLAGGYYLVLDTTGDGIILDVVKTTSIAKKSTQDITVDKRINKDQVSFSYNETVPFAVEVYIPENATAYSTYSLTLTDTLTNLEYVASSLKVYDKADADKTEITAPSFTAEVGTIDTTGDLSSQILTIKNTAISGDDIAKIAGSTLVFTYEAKVKSNAFTYDGTKNEVKATYSNNPSDSSSTTNTPPDTVEIPEYRIKVVKKDAATGNALTGANFTITKDSTTYNATDADSETVYNEKTDEKLNGAAVSEFYFNALGEGVYTLTEAVVPSGYNKADDITITIGHNESTGTVTITKKVGADGTEETIAAVNGVIEIEVPNKSGSTLPSTGGMGTKIFYTLGGILVACAGVMLVTKRRMRTN